MFILTYIQSDPLYMKPLTNFLPTIFRRKSRIPVCGEKMSGAAASRVLFSLFLLLFLGFPQVRLAHTNGYVENGTVVEMVPLIEPGKMEMVLNDSRRRLGSFQICALCTCCGGASKNYCVPSPCCYAINCNIPNRPFGFCSFTPKTCNCFGCHL